MKFDILNLQYLLPAFILKMPYDFMNRRNRNKLIENDDSLASSITVEDFSLDANRADFLDHFMIVKK